MSKGSVLMIISKYNGVGGADVVMNNLCSGLKHLGYETAIGAFSFATNPPGNIEKVYLKKFRSLSGTTNKNFDIIHIHQPKMIYFSFLDKNPIVFHYHGANGKIQELNLKIAMSFFKNHISRIISVSYTGLNQMQNILGNISADVVYNGVDTAFYNTDLPKPYSKGEPQLLFVGNLYHTKKVGRLIDAMHRILELYPNAHLQVVGYGDDYDILKRRIKAKQLEKNVELVGRISKDELRLRYSSCDVYVSTSFFEVCPVPPIEAMACGKPLLLSDISPHNEMIEFSKAGLTFSFSDDQHFCNQLEKVYNNKQSFGISARKFAENNNWSIVCKKVARIYDEILGLDVGRN